MTEQTPLTTRFSLAPMEGVVDATMRRILTNIAGVDECVTEFLRVTNTTYPDKVFRKICPELANGCQTDSGTPVTLQILGGDPESMTRNALKAVSLGATKVDVNFGCPAKTVNRSDGGAIILREPERVSTILARLRTELPSRIPLSAKMRLGYEDKTLMIENALAAQSAGICKLTVHGRTKREGYKPPADWYSIKQISDALDIPVVPNGDITSVESFRRCREIVSADEYMVGRGLLANPGLINEIRGLDALSWQQFLPHLFDFQESEMEFGERRHQGNRIKQWLAYLKQHYKEANSFFDEVKRMTNPDDILRRIEMEMGN